MGRLLTVTGYGFTLARNGERFRVRRKTGASEHPAEELDLILLTGKGTVTTEAISLAVRRGIPIFFARPSGYPYASILPSVSTGAGSTRREQVLAYYDERGVQLIKEFVRGKLVNQVNLLRYAALSRERSNPSLAGTLRDASEYIGSMVDLIEEAEGDLEEVCERLRSIEGNAAKVYWEAYSLMMPEWTNFRGRITYGAKDPVNMLLNFGYGYLRIRVTAAVFFAGLDPFIGFMHADRSMKPSLVLDMMEEFRPLVTDRAILNLAARRKISPQWFDSGGLTKQGMAEVLEALEERMDHRVRYEGRKYRLSTVIRLQAKALVGHLKRTSKYRAVTGW
ncbi:MAG: CRISPR-associated endonuclease Cas1 [Candidatus Korarchaeota archaeon]|nr:CRISPR-associated endonuclease Cas1 [Candidatus Korarchaeota archaeon]